MPTKDWAKGRDDETGPGAETKSERPRMSGNPARGKVNEHKQQEPHRGRQKAASWKGGRVDVGDARENAR